MAALNVGAARAPIPFLSTKVTPALQDRMREVLALDAPVRLDVEAHPAKRAGLAQVRVNRVVAWLEAMSTWNSGLHMGPGEFAELLLPDVHEVQIVVEALAEHPMFSGHLERTVQSDRAGLPASKEGGAR